ncbi:MAG: chemotaxis protein CheB [Leptothrix sp. (in: b-proteobacteria)]
MASSKAAASPRAGRQRKTEPGADTQQAGQPATSIVGIGASAGGLEAFEQFLRAMPADSGLGLVLIQHLDPSHESLLVDILQRATTMPVVQALDQMPVLPDRVHVIPPNRDLAIRHGVLNVTLPVAPHGLRMPIDAFLRSLAEDQGDAAAGIVLSGTGTDGTLGLRAIFGAGGLCLVQSPANAKYGGMPASAISAGYANQVLDVEKMPRALIDGVRFGCSKVVGEVARHAPVTSGLNRIIAQLRSATGHDFSQYKQSTVSRRIERRMATHHLDDMEAFALYASEHPDELQALFRELLINVTSFFRDPDAFVTLKHKVLPALVTVNAELHTKIEQMATIQDDMRNLLENIRGGTIFLDRHLVIRRFTLAWPRKRSSMPSAARWWFSTRHAM